MPITWPVTGQTPHLISLVIGKGFGWESDWEVRIRRRTEGSFVRRLYITCSYTAVQPARQKWGMSNPDTGNSSNDRLLELCLQGWLVCGQSDRWNVGGWICSKPVGWLVVLFAVIGRLVGWMVGAWLACRLVCLLSGLSDETSGRLIIQPITDWPAIHPFFGSDQCLYFRYRNWGSTYSQPTVRTVGCGGVTYAMPASLWSSLGRISSRLSGGIPLAYPRIDLGTLPKGCLTCFAVPGISIHSIYSHIVYSLECSPTTTCNGLKSIIGDTPHGLERVAQKSMPRTDKICVYHYTYMNFWNIQKFHIRNCWNGWRITLSVPIKTYISLPFQ